MATAFSFKTYRREYAGHWPWDILIIQLVITKSSKFNIATFVAAILDEVVVKPKREQYEKDNPGGGLRKMMTSG